MDEAHPSTREKALALNLEPATYGTLAEIGAGQEVARWFFHVGGAAGTVAKTISAYDMAVSDGFYGPAEHYVSRQRLTAMLDHEYAELLARLGSARGERTAFFAFADTVATQSYQHPGKGHGWLGVRFEAAPREEPSEVLIHASLFDSTAVLQQEALGILGVNVIHGAYFHHRKPLALIGSLLDDLTRTRVEIDMIRVAGPAFAGVDNRLMSLQLVEQRLTDAAMFTAAGEVVQPSEVLHGKPVLVERGSFRPITNLTLDLLERARDRFVKEPGVHGRTPVVLMEMTLSDLDLGQGIDQADFLARADILGRLGLNVLISRFEPYYQLAEYLTASTTGLIAIAVGLPALTEIALEEPSDKRAGGILESTGRLFKRSVKMYVHPTRDSATGTILEVDTAPMPHPWQYFRTLLLETGHLVPIRDYDPNHLSISSPAVLTQIQAGEPGWERFVPPAAAEAIKAGRLFGCGA